MWNTRKFSLLFLASLGIFSLLACNLTARVAGTPAAEGVLTQSAETVAVQLTQSALTSTAPPLIASPTLALSSPTPLGSVTQAPTTTTRPTTTVATLCNRAQFVEDITIPDGTVIAQAGTFTKVWRLKNTGTCPWTTGYHVLFTSGEKMGNNSWAALPRSVEPGQTVDVSIDLVAPSKPGSYQGNWMLRSASGEVFGIGANATQSFWVNIRVMQDTSRWRVYTNDFYKVALRYPENWTYIEGTPQSGEKYGAEDGFFKIGALLGDMTLDQAAGSLVSQPNKPYGSDPTIERLTIQGERARLILPSKDQNPNMAGASALIVRYPQAVIQGGNTYQLFVLYADVDYVREIAGTLTFSAFDPVITPTLFPPDSNTPAAGICADMVGEVVIIPITLNMPDPRCVKVAANQRPALVNQTGATLSVRLAWNQLTLQPGETFVFNTLFGSFLAPGVHHVVILGNAANSPEIWLAN